MMATKTKKTFLEVIKMYFQTVTTAEELKQLYKSLAKELHPDNGGDVEEFKRMQNDYSNVWERVKNIHRNANGEEYTKETSETAKEYTDIIDKIIGYQFAKVEICGSWIWVSGDTKPIKDTLKSIGFKWSKNKIAWYYHQDAYKKRNNKRYSLEEIREMWGSEEIENEKKYIS